MPQNSDIYLQLRQEFIESSRDQIEDIEVKLDLIESGQSDAVEETQSIQRYIPTIKGQGGSFGYPLTGRVAHMLEDYLENAGGIQTESIPDIHVYLNLMLDLISTQESIAQDDPQSLLSALPTGQTVTFSTQQTHDINVLLVMPAGLQRKLVAKELLSCGFRVMRAYHSLEALSVAVDLAPDIVFVNYDMSPFNGRELANMFAAVDKLRDIHFVLLTSYEAGSENLADLPDNISVVQKHKDFTESIGELMIQWGVFGNIPQESTNTDRPISRHPKTANVVKVITQRPLKILVAEDNLINQQLIKATIEGFGHQLEIADNGMRAVEAVIGEDFDLVFMDVRMPEMSGPDATRAIRQLPGDESSIPIIAVTADATQKHMSQYIKAGMNACVGKPIDRAELLDAIDMAMGEEIHLRVEVDAPEHEQGETKETRDSGPDGTAEATDADIEDFLKQLQDVAKEA